MVAPLDSKILELPGPKNRIFGPFWTEPLRESLGSVLTTEWNQQNHRPADSMSKYHFSPERLKPSASGLYVLAIGMLSSQRDACLAGGGLF